ncbi:Hypothetical predicted protein [Octopus vulgaris]|uniref:PiggyBac transposable element-derived protein domain-containing protein n=1 Tax=Octopus vulgaris TaxID=6645 RepID=A0AA36AQI7_OCTVU|nr:Hypothetical predicted protein [Octopus vulgaris]
MQYNNDEEERRMNNESENQTGICIIPRADGDVTDENPADNNELDSKDRFAEVCPFLDLLNESFIQFSSVFGPTNASIYEYMIPYYDGILTKQLIRGKPIRWGYKGWVAASVH